MSNVEGAFVPELSKKRKWQMETERENERKSEVKLCIWDAGRVLKTWLTFIEDPRVLDGESSGYCSCHVALCITLANYE